MKDNSEIPVINVTLTSRTIKGGKTIKLTVRNVFYTGIINKIKTLWYWYWDRSEKTSWHSYLNESVTWTREDASELEMFTYVPED